MSRSDIGVIHGRFQPLHLGPMEYLLAGKTRCRFLYVGITNPDPYLTKETETNKSRSLSQSNPFTYYERMLMIRDGLIEAGVPHDEFAIVPFPINLPELIRHYTPEQALYFVTVYDDWGDAKISILKNLGLKVDIMWRRKMTERLTSGTEVRRLMKDGGEWRTLVPAAVSRIFDQNNLAARLQSGDQNGE